MPKVRVAMARSPGAYRLIIPRLAQEFGVESLKSGFLGLVLAKDRQIFEAAREAKVVVLTKDSDFALWLERLGPPPQVLWLRCGNTSNAYLTNLLRNTLPDALEMIKSGESLVEIVD